MKQFSNQSMSPYVLAAVLRASSSPLFSELLATASPLYTAVQTEVPVRGGEHADSPSHRDGESDV
ncbi:hypothetical protein DLM46_36400 [Paraburkholderia lacunae]|uniref:Uncharacterized protein n=2 Tax=Paraburkholderia lacunae TaxID=2211104 RepID=A0A370MWI4_9BURK|nr:hypothetical protein DLM46_36400 [Paraburkholderia lacunae]